MRTLLPHLLVAMVFMSVTSIDTMAQKLQDQSNAIGMTKPTDGITAVDEVALASRLIDFGLSHDDATALVAAARILVHTGARPSTATQEGHDDHAEPSADDRKSAAETVDFSPEALLEEAQRIGGAGIDEMIAEVRSMMTQDRGRQFGPAVLDDYVSARATDTWNLGDFRGGEYARVIVDGDGDTDLDCYIYDQNGYFIDSDEDTTDYCVLEWYPRYTGSFSLVIRNLGGVYNAYRLSTN